MKQMIDIIRNQWQQGKAVILVTIIQQEGSTPRGVGAQMLVGEQGLLCGTIGGGSIEKNAILEAQQLFLAKESKCQRFE